MRALIADDDRMTATLVASALRRWGLEVTVAHDGASAWAALQQEPPPGLVLLDWMMPDIEGPELCRRIRQDVTRAHLHVLLLTTRNARADVVAGLDAGADDYLTKPFDVEELRARVQVGVRALALQERLVERVADLERALVSIKQLRGLLPICSYCKRVRSGANYWEQVEHYIVEHTEATFTHGICPTCYDSVLAQLEGVTAEVVARTAGRPKS